MRIKSLTQLLAICSLGLITGCTKDNQVSKERTFNGKYEIVSAISDKDIDVNLDGVAQTDLLQEIPQLKASYLELIARDNSGNYTFSQFWQNQYFLGVEGRPQNYSPAITINYMNQATVAKFEVLADNTIQLSREVPNSTFPLPNKVKIVTNNNIEVLMSKELLTKTGWVTVDVDVIYKRLD